MATMFAERLRSMGLRGQTAYACVDGEECVAIPAQVCTGRTGTSGKTFSGWINLRTGEMRFDCAEELPFHLQVRLGEIDAFKYAPGAPHADAAVERCEARATEVRAQQPYA